MDRQLKCRWFNEYIRCTSICACWSIDWSNLLAFRWSTWSSLNSSSNQKSFIRNIFYCCLEWTTHSISSTIPASRTDSYDCVQLSRWISQSISVWSRQANRWTFSCISIRFRKGNSYWTTWSIDFEKKDVFFLLFSKLK